MPEEWRPVVGWEGLYEVSSLGRVRSLDRICDNGRRRKGRTLQLLTSRNGYCHVALARSGRVRSALVHRLVLAAFIGEPRLGEEACHGNGARADNRLSNLRWATHSQNELDKIRHGTHPQLAKTHCPYGHAYSAGNLRADVPAGGRGCLACHRGQEYARRHGVEYTQEIADMHASRRR